MIDAEARFSDRQALTATAVSNDIIEFEPHNHDIGAGEAVFLNVIVANPDKTAATLNVHLQVAPGEDMAGAEDVAIWEIPAEVIAKGGPVLSASLPAKLSRGYGRLNYVMTTFPANFTVTALLGQQGQTNG